MTEPLFEKWRAQPNDMIGGWCVTLASDTRTPAEGALTICDFLSEDIAEHVTELHNRTLS